MRTCRICKVEKPLTEFARNISYEDNLDTRCVLCVRAYNRNRYATSSTLRAKRYEDTKKVRERNSRYVWEYLLAHPCVDCGEGDPVVLDFDHRDPKEKSFNIGDREAVSLNKLDAEIAKCDVRCRNCHIKRTARQFGWYKWQVSSAEKGSVVGGI